MSNPWIAVAVDPDSSEYIVGFGDTDSEAIDHLKQSIMEDAETLKELSPEVSIQEICECWTLVLVAETTPMPELGFNFQRN
jgi:hypothetical protein